MKISAVIFVVASVLLYSDSTYGVCPANEIQASCGAACEPSCRDPNPLACPTHCIVDGCRCQPGFLRDESTGTCVVPVRCGSGSGGGVMVVENSCGPNESVDPCGPVCEPTCNNPTPTVCPANCIINGCRCNSGFFRDHRGRCVESHGCLLRG